MKKLKFLLISSVFLINSCNNMKDYSNLTDGIYADIQTNKGDMILKLTYEETPLTVSNFIALAEGNHPLASEEFKNKPYYNGIKFHRVIDNFMIQGGDPTGTGQVDQDIVLKMNLLIALNMMGLVFCPWLIQDQIPMVVNFLSLI